MSVLVLVLTEVLNGIFCCFRYNEADLINCNNDNNNDNNKHYQQTCQWQSDWRVSNDDYRNRQFCEMVREMLLKLALLIFSSHNQINKSSVSFSYTNDYIWP